MDQRETPQPERGSSDFIAPSAEDLDAVLDQYEFIEILGQGGMGAVYKGRQKVMNRLVAIKILPQLEDVGGEMRFADRFKREARAMAKLSHPNIITVYDFGETTDGQLFFVMEYVDGSDLHQLVRTGDLTVEHFFGWVPQICDALQYAHDCGIVHRDIKPANIMITREGNVKIADFGLAKAIGSSAAQMTQLTMTNMAMGTPDYVAPEVLESGTEIDHRVDLYSLGVMLYQMLTGKVPRGSWKAPSSLAAGVDPRLDRLIEKAMDGDRESRFQQASEISSTLSEIRVGPAEPVRRQPKLVTGPVQPKSGGGEQPGKRVVAKKAVSDSQRASTEKSKQGSPAIKWGIAAAAVIALAAVGLGIKFLGGGNPVSPSPLSANPSPAVSAITSDKEFELLLRVEKNHITVTIDGRLVNEHTLTGDSANRSGTIVIQRNSGGRPGARVSYRNLRIRPLRASTPSASTPSPPPATIPPPVTPTGDGLDLKLGEALSRAKPGDTIWLAPGTYPAITSNDRTFLRTENLTLLGNRSRLDGLLVIRANGITIDSLETGITLEGVTQARAAQYADTDGPKNITIRNCRLDGFNPAPNSETKIENSLLGLVSGFRATISIDHCTLVGSTNPDIPASVFGNESILRIVNSIVTGSDNDAFYVMEPGPAESDIRNTLFHSFDNRFRAWIDKPGTPSGISTSTRPTLNDSAFKKLNLTLNNCIVNQNPEFLTPSYHKVRDYRLGPDSIAKGAAEDGTNLGALPDADGWPLFINRAAESDPSPAASQPSPVAGSAKPPICGELHTCGTDVNGKPIDVTLASLRGRKDYVSGAQYLL